MDRVQIYGAFIALSALVVCVSDPPGVTESGSSFSCDDPKFPIDRRCDNWFLNGDMVYARVNKFIVDVKEPFKFLEDEGEMQLLECMDFTHRSLCAVDDDFVKEEITHYQPEPFSKLDSSDAGASIQGCFFSVLLAMALIVVMFG